MIEIYSFGYKNKRFTPYAKELISKDISIVIDTRFNPNCFDPFWKKKSIEDQLPFYNIEYHHIKDFGNKKYFEAGTIEINNLESGMNSLWQILENKGKSRFCLLCTCENLELCHNNMIVKELEKTEKYIYKSRI